MRVVSCCPAPASVNLHSCSVRVASACRFVSPYLALSIAEKSSYWRLRSRAPSGAWPGGMRKKTVPWENRPSLNANSQRSTGCDANSPPRKTRLLVDVLESLESFTSGRWERILLASDAEVPHGILANSCG